MPEWIELPEYVVRGKQMRHGKGWRLVSPRGETAFKATLVKHFRTTGGDRVAIFQIREPPEKSN